MKNRFIIGASVAAATALSGAASAQHEKPACDRACLKGFADAFFEALLADDPSLARAAPTVRATLNGEETPLAEVLWAEAEAASYRLEAFDPEHGGIGVLSRVTGSDGDVVLGVRLKVEDGAVTEVETIAAREGMADRLWGPESMTEVSPKFQLSMRPVEQDTYYGLIATVESYWRAFETNGTEDYRQAPFLPDVSRHENGLQTTETMALGGPDHTPNQQFNVGRFPGRNIWDRRYPVVDVESGVAMAVVRFGLQEGADPAALNRPDRLVMEWFAVQNGQISEVAAVLINRPDAEPTGW
jgi:hypothetical protein